MHRLYPNNAFFHRFVARNSFALGKLTDAERYAKELLKNLDEGRYGYGANDGRYGAYILAYINHHRYNNLNLAKEYYAKSMYYALDNDSKKTGYYASSNLALGKIAILEKNYKAGIAYLGDAMKNSDKNSTTYNDANTELKELTKMLKTAKRKK